MMKLKLVTLLLCLVVAAPAWASHSSNALPYDGAASQNTKDLLAYLQNLPHRSDHRLVTGQWGDWNGFNAKSIERQDRIFSLSGQRPGLWGNQAYKAITGPPCLLTLNAGTIQNTINWWNAGGLVMIDIWPPNPHNGRCADDEGPGGVHDLNGTPANIYTDNGNAMNLAYKASLDAIAAQFQLLEDAGVVIICKCFTEMNQPYFWWGTMSNSQYIALWKYTQDYFRVTKGLHNILWEYSPMDQMGSDTEWQGKYPGDAFVDMVGIDMYGVYTPRVQPRYNAAGKHRAYDSMTATSVGKPFWAGELGCQQYGENLIGPPVDQNACYNTFRDAMPLTVGVMNWNDGWAMDFNTNLAAAMANPWVQNRPVPITGGGPAPPPPPPPFTATVRVTTPSTDNVGVTSYQVRRCQGAPCDATVGTSVGSITPPATTFVDTTVLQSQSYTFTARGADAAGNLSAWSNLVDFNIPTTTPATSFSDDFNRADNADLGANYDNGYTNVNKTNAAIVSNEVRATSLNASDPKSVESLNAVTLSNDQFCEITLGTFTGSTDREIGCSLRMANVPTINWYWCYARKTATNSPARNSAIVSHHTGGVGDTNLASDFVTVWGSGDKLRCEAEGTTLRLFRTPFGTSASAKLLEVTDSEWTSGKAGLVLWVHTAGSLATATVTDFRAGNFTAATPIAFDSVSNSAAGNTTNSIPITHTVGSSTTDILLVCAYARDTVAGDTAVTGVSSSVDGAFTKIRHDEQTSGGSTFRTELWYLLNPTTGAHTITTTWTGALAQYGVASALSLAGVSQSSPIDAQGGGTGNSATMSAAVTTVAANAQITACGLSQSPNLTATTGQTERVDRETTGTVDSVALSTVDQKATPGLETLTWTTSTSGNWTVSAASFTPTSTAAVAAPRIASVTNVTATGTSVTVGSTLPTTIRVQDNRGSIVLPFMAFIPTFTQTISEDFGGALSNWTTNTGLNAIAVSGGIGRATALNTAAGSTHNTTVGANQYAQVTLPAWAGSSDQYAEVTVRWDKAANSGYLCGVARDGTTGEHIYITKRTTGTSTVQVYTPINVSAGDILKCHAIGNFLVASLNGVPIVSTTDTANTYPTGQVGLLAFVTSGSTSDFTFDTFRAGTVAAPYAHTFTGVQDGLTFKRYLARDSAGIENQLTADVVEVSLVGIVTALDVTPIVMSDPQPASILPAGTTSRTISFAIDKPGACRVSTTNQGYDAMGTAGNMTISGGRASFLAETLTDGINRRYFGHCRFTNAIDTDIDTVTSIIIDVRVASPVDVTPPIITSGPTTINLAAGTTAHTIQVSTNENATVKGSLSSGTAYAAMAITFAGGGTQTHTHNLTGLTNGSTTNLYVRASDGTNPTLVDYQFTVIVTGLAPDVSPPIITDILPVGTLAAGTTTTNITFTTNESATCKYGSISGRVFTNPFLGTFSTTGGTSHSQSISPLTDNSTYRYYVLCQDAAGNTAPEFAVAWDVAVAAGDTTAPGTLAGVVATGISPTEGTVLWPTGTDNVGVRGYHVLLASGDCSTYTEVQFVLFPLVTYTIPNLLPDTAYCATVTVEDTSSNLGTTSNVATFTTEANVDTTPPSDMANFRGTVFTHSVHLEWSQCVDPESGSAIAVIERCLNEECASFTVEAALTGQSFTSAALTPLTTNYFRGHCSDGRNRSVNDTPVLGFTLPTTGSVAPRPDAPFGTRPANTGALVGTRPTRP